MDNGIKVFNYLGELVYEERVPDLYQVNWRPSPKGSFPQKEIEVAKKATTEGPAKYRHPHAAQASNQAAIDNRGRVRAHPLDPRGSFLQFPSSLTQNSKNLACWGLWCLLLVCLTFFFFTLSIWF